MSDTQLLIATLRELADGMHEMNSAFEKELQDL